MATITPEIASFLEHTRLCFVATVSPDGRPNVSPKGTLVALDSERLAFADIRSPDTVANIKHNARVEISAIDPILRRGYLFAGTASIRMRGAEFDRACATYLRIGIKSRIRAVIIVKSESISEVVSPLYDLGVSEDDVRKSWIRRYTKS